MFMICYSGVTSFIWGYELIGCKYRGFNRNYKMILNKYLLLENTFYIFILRQALDDRYTF